MGPMEFFRFGWMNEHAGAKGGAGRKIEELARVVCYPVKNPRRVNILESTGGVNAKSMNADGLHSTEILASQGCRFDEARCARPLRLSQRIPRYIQIPTKIRSAVSR